MVSNSKDSIEVAKANEQHGESLLHLLPKESKTYEQDAICTSRNPVTIRLERGVQGLGFNIVGGKDNPHIPGHSGIFVSVIKSHGPAYNDGRLSVGDLILSVNGIELADKTHDEAVSIFRSLKNSPVELLVDIGAENRILNQEPLLDGTNSFAVKSSVVEDCELTKSTLRPKFRQGYENGSSFTSQSPSYVQDVKNDVPRTPKRPISYLDPRNPSIVTEILYVSIGFAVISVGIYVVYRISKGRR